MAIQFARCEYVGRSGGKNAVCKGAYNGRLSVKDEASGAVYDFRSKGDNAYHSVKIPGHGDERFSDEHVLFNAVERAERRKDSQLWVEHVVALPDDVEVSVEMRKEIFDLYVERCGFLEQGRAVVVDMHRPHEGDDHNWHGHILVSTRAFTEDGKSFGKKIREEGVFGGPGYRIGKKNIGQIAKECQETVFERHGLSLKVDAISESPGEHLGPIRMRGMQRVYMREIEETRPEWAESIDMKMWVDPAFQKLVRESENHEFRQNSSEFWQSADVQQQLLDIHMRIDNQKKHESGLGFSEVTSGVKNEKTEDEFDSFCGGEAQGLDAKTLDNLFKNARQEYENQKDSGPVSSAEVLDFLHQQKSTFTSHDLTVLFRGRMRESVREEVLSHESVERISESRYVLTPVQDEESRTLRWAERLHRQRGAPYAGVGLSEAQRQAVEGLHAGRLKILEGRAGTGKSHVLGMIAREHTQGRVIGLAPTHKACRSLHDHGMEHTDTVKGFLFRSQSQPVARDTLLLVDEAGMVDNRSYQELFRVAHKHSCHVVLCGDSRQLQAVERGGMFSALSQKYGAQSLETIHRQQEGWQKEISASMASGEVHKTLDILKDHGRLHLAETVGHSSAALLETWGQSHADVADRLILTTRRSDVKVLNLGAREVLKNQGKLSEESITIGKKEYAVGERLIITKTQRDMGVHNGDRGTLLSASKDAFTIHMDKGETVTLAPKGIDYGYASTVFKAQGQSVSETFVLHDSATNAHSSYVALSRHKDDVHLFVNTENTPSFSRLCYQMSRSKDEDISVSFPEEKQAEGLWDSLKLWGEKIMTSLEDRFYKDTEYYHVKTPEIPAPSVDTKFYADTSTNHNFSESVKNKMDDDLMALNQGLKVLDFNGKGQEDYLSYELTFVNNEDLRAAYYGEHYEALTSYESRELSLEEWEKTLNLSKENTDVQEDAKVRDEQREQPQKDYQHEM